MTTQQILNSNATKTRKMQQLFELGMSRAEVARVMNTGYGFVQNVYAKTYPERINRRTRRAIQRAFRLGRFDRKFGVEIEFYGTKGKSKLLQILRAKGVNVNSESYNHQTRPHWKIVTDSSISPSRGTGLEIVSPILEGEEGLEELNKVCEALSEWGALINRSCGLHIHFNARNFNLNTWKNLYINYMAYEGEMDKMMPRSRRANNNGYCRSIKRIGSLETAKRKINACNTMQKIASEVCNRGRYFKLNSESYHRHGSVEFRHHSGTRDFDKISNWIKLLHGLTSYSEQGFTAQNANFEEMKQFLTEETYSFYYNRIEELAI